MTAPMTAPKAHPSTQSLFDYVIWVPVAFYAVLFAFGLFSAAHWTDALMLSFTAAIFALLACGHSANARRIRQLDAAVRQLQGRTRDAQ